MQTNTLTRVYNLNKDSRSRIHNVPFLLVIFLFLNSIIPASVVGGDIDWSILLSKDTLVVYTKDVQVGKLYSEIDVDSTNKTIKVFEKIVISHNANLAGSFSGVSQEHIRTFDFSGKQTGASLTMKSPSGTAMWKLEPKEIGNWQLSVSAGGMVTTTTVNNVKGNLLETYVLHKGIKDKDITVGGEWKDSLFELTSAKNTIITTTCEAIPGKDNPYYVFISHDELTGIDSRQEIDTAGRIILQEVPPIMVAKRYSTIDKKEKEKTQHTTKIDYLYELFNVSVDRAQKNSETIALSVKPGTKIHRSVMRFYTYKDNKYIMKNLNTKCHTKQLSVKKESLKGWLSSTVTVQSNHREIKELAMTLKGTRTCRCEIAKTYSNYLFRNIEKKHVATFSNAYETLKAGYGDCGEHAVLLCALLRSIGIESNVVYGMVYSPAKKSYYYHAWVVAFIKDLLFFDPALGVNPATKGYIPLILDDDGTKMVYLAGMIGKVEVGYVSIK